MRLRCDSPLACGSRRVLPAEWRVETISINTIGSKYFSVSPKIPKFKLPVIRLCSLGSAGSRLFYFGPGAHGAGAVQPAWALLQGAGVNGWLPLIEKKPTAKTITTITTLIFLLIVFSLLSLNILPRGRLDFTKRLMLNNSIIYQLLKKTSWGWRKGETNSRTLTPYFNNDYRNKISRRTLSR